jgi:MFS family permease
MQKYGRRFAILAGMAMESLGFFIFWLAGFIDTIDHNGWYILVVIVSRIMAGFGCVSIQIAAQSISMIFY